MNQGVQVLDGFTYIESKQAIQIELMSGGEILFCFITGADKQSLIQLYKDKQFEIEELIEQAVSEDDLDHNGEVNLTADDVLNF